MKLKLPKLKKHFRKGGIHTDPEIYWITCLLIAAAIVIWASFFGFYLFNDINRELSSITSSGGLGNDVLNREGLEKILNYFSEREQRTDKIIYSEEGIVDPSI